MTYDEAMNWVRLGGDPHACVSLSAMADANGNPWIMFGDRCIGSITTTPRTPPAAGGDTIGYFAAVQIGREVAGNLSGRGSYAHDDRLSAAYGAVDIALGLEQRSTPLRTYLHGVHARAVV
jgi:hypothetical protein